VQDIWIFIEILANNFGSHGNILSSYFFHRKMPMVHTVVLTRFIFTCLQKCWPFQKLIFLKKKTIAFALFTELRNVLIIYNVSRSSCFARRKLNECRPDTYLYRAKRLTTIKYRTFAISFINCCFLIYFKVKKRTRQPSGILLYNV
jgi:hypothetical protein